MELGGKLKNFHGVECVSVIVDNLDNLYLVTDYQFLFISFTCRHVSSVHALQSYVKYWSFVFFHRFNIVVLLWDDSHNNLSLIVLLKHSGITDNQFL